MKRTGYKKYRFGLIKYIGAFSVLFPSVSYAQEIPSTIPNVTIEVTGRVVISGAIEKLTDGLRLQCEVYFWAEPFYVGSLIEVREPNVDLPLKLTDAISLGDGEYEIPYSYDLVYSEASIGNMPEFGGTHVSNCSLTDGDGSAFYSLSGVGKEAVAPVQPGSIVESWTNWRGRPNEVGDYILEDEPGVGVRSPINSFASP